MQVAIEESWKEVLAEEFSEDYFRELTDFVREQYQKETVYPPPKELFRAFSMVPYRAVRVVILGQDPYHNVGQANGLCFAVHEGVVHPPSLRNVFKEITEDLTRPPHTDSTLTSWAEQGVFLLNATLTVRRGEAGSHQGKGWERFTDSVVRTLSDTREGLVFMLWGANAGARAEHIDQERHLVLKAPHPSPLSAHRGFFGSHHFSKANEYLESRGEAPIVW